VSTQALDESGSIAERRGVVQRHLPRKGNISDLSIISPGLVAFVCAARLVKLSSTVEDIVHDFAAAIARLRLIVSSLVISRELWLRTPRGKWRFFRILDAGILELDRDGVPLANGTQPAGCAAPGGQAGSRCNGNGGTRGIPDGCPAMNMHMIDPAAGQPDRPDGAAGPSSPAGAGAEVPGQHQDASAGAPKVPAAVPPALPPPVPAAVRVTDPPAAPEPDLPPGISAELIRRFMRWREEKRKKGTGPG
jgi:hypothetical protein